MGLELDVKKHLLTAHRERFDGSHVVKVPDEQTGRVNPASEVCVGFVARANHAEVDDAQRDAARQNRCVPVRQCARGVVNLATRYDEQRTSVIRSPGANLEGFLPVRDQTGPRLLNDNSAHPHIVGCHQNGATHE